MAGFGTTKWSLIIAAGDPVHRARALERLCTIYRPPVVGWLRRRGLDADQAEDHAQSFFAHLLEKDLVGSADPELGRFRAYLITALRNFYSHQREAAAAAKRGGGTSPLALDEHRDATSDCGPDEAFDRDFALTLLGRSLERLRDEAASAGRLELFQALREYLVEAPAADDYERLAQRLGMRRNTLAVAVHRLRARLKQIVRDELMETVGDESHLDQEMRALRRTLSGVAGDR